MFTTAFWKSTAERAIKTFAQALAAVLTVDVLMDGDQLVPALVAAALAAGISVLTSVASIGAADKGTPSLVKEPGPDPVLDPLPPQQIPDESPTHPDDRPGLDEDDLGDDDGSVL